MKLKNKVAVVTGGASGIGKALCLRFAIEGARVVVADLDEERAKLVARETNGLAIRTDVSDESQIVQLVERASREVGPIDLFCSNAGIGGKAGGVEVANQDWQRIWEVNFMSHVYAARAVLPGMLSRGDGYLLNTASAAGLLTSLGAAPYAVTKHAAVSFAEWLAITYGDRGIKVSCLCPQGVNTPMLEESMTTTGKLLKDGALEPEEVAEAVVAALAEERFLVLPHPEVHDYFVRKAGDYDRWLRGMRRLQARMDSA
jgi:NAD(P)-dependent dehydrogenase (short-subunit alcohol dehydrogenase family)